ncbi:MAG: type 1 glutamine amidotransferase [Deltaproteobacteria bacterium]|nr:type 1 glutamine amidotransferase [Deltaproteobacteria bacterium]
MKKPILVIQHVESEGLGTIGGILCKRGFDTNFVKVFKDEHVPKTADGYDALIVLGGPMGVYEEDVYPFIKDEIALIKNAIKNNIPILGICLGSQLLAKAAGAQVYKGKKKEIGWYKINLTEEGKRDEIFIGLPDEFTVFQWHGDTFDAPNNSKNLASSDLFPNQIIKVGRNAYGLQFHLEVTEEMIRDWIDVNDNELKSVKAYINPENILEDTSKNIETLNKYGEVVFKKFFALIK